MSGRSLASADGAVVGRAGPGGDDDEACAALMSFAAASDDDRPAFASPHAIPAPAPDRNVPAAIPASLVGNDDIDSNAFPVNKIMAIMSRALPPGAYVSRDAKRAVQRCVCEFICFLTSEACDRGGKIRHSIDANDILHAFRHLGFHKFSNEPQSYVERFRETQQQQQQQDQADAMSAPMQPTIAESMARSSRQVRSREPGEVDAAPSPKQQRLLTPIVIPTAVPHHHQQPQHMSVPSSPDIHALKSLREASFEVASSLVHAWSSPIIETALLLAGSPVVSSMSHAPSPPLVPFASGPVRSSTTMSPMFLSRLGLAMAPPILPYGLGAPMSSAYNRHNISSNGCREPRQESFQHRIQCEPAPSEAVSDAPDSEQQQTTLGTLLITSASPPTLPSSPPSKGERAGDVDEPIPPFGI